MWEWSIEMPGTMLLQGTPQLIWFTLFQILAAAFLLNDYSCVQKSVLKARNRLLSESTSSFNHSMMPFI